MHLFSYSDYKSYVNDRLEERGRRSALARAIRCQSAYVSSVLRGLAHFTPEQGEAINDFFGHSEAEADFFLLLLQIQRAGSEALRRRLGRQMDKIREGRYNLKKRLHAKPLLRIEDQAIYYSEWFYSAIHALVSIPEYASVGAVSNRLALEPVLVAEAVDFLVQCGILSRTKQGLKVGLTQIHLGADSPLISKHHMNWRLRSMQNLGVKSREDLHYSSAISLAKKDSERIKEMIVRLIQAAKVVIQDSKDESLCCFAVDFFEV